ncbi:MAG TPA: patatin-like phospholipase family protein, partial [Longimicrobiales bacterium]|nr:patatin-like phospholipase family protein [Longimicrobiales bacterium]
MREVTTPRPRVGLALGGGAARGYAHLGVLRVLEQEGIRPDLIVGTSAGALAGVFLAAGFSVERIEAWAAGLRWSLIARPVVSRLGFVSNDRLGRLLRRTLPVQTFQELSLPFACVATDVATSDPVVIADGDIPSAIQASCAIPGIVTPVRRDGRMLMDGGVSANVPTSAARSMGADIVIAVDVNGGYRPARPPTHFVSILIQAFSAVGRLAELRDGADADVLIAPDIGD